MTDTTDYTWTPSPVSYRAMWHTSTADHSVVDELRRLAGKEAVAAKAADQLGKNTNIVFADYDENDPSTRRAFIPWDRFLAKEQLLHTYVTAMTGAVRVVEELIGDPVREGVYEVGEDATVTLNLGEVNRILAALGIDEVKAEREYEVSVRATAEYRIRVKARNEDEASAMAADAFSQPWDDACFQAEYSMSDIECDGTDLEIFSTDEINW